MKQMLSHVDDYRKLELLYVHLYEEVSGTTLPGYTQAGSEACKTQEMGIESQEDILKFVKRHCELFRVYYHDNMDKRNEGIHILLERLSLLSPDIEGSREAFEMSLSVLKDNWILGINHKEVADIFSRSLAVVSSDEDSAARIVRLDINQILVEIVRADRTAPKRWNWVTKAMLNMAFHPRLRQSLIKGNCLSSILACCQLASATLLKFNNGGIPIPMQQNITAHKKNKSNEGDEDVELQGSRENIPNDVHQEIDVEDITSVSLTWEEDNLNVNTLIMISEALEKLSIAKNTRGWMISKGCMLSLKRLALMYKYPYILKNVVSTIENLVEEKQAARIAARENALEVLGIVWKFMSNVKIAREIPEEDLSCIKSKTKNLYF